MTLARLLLNGSHLTIGPIYLRNLGLIAEVERAYGTSYWQLWYARMQIPPRGICQWRLMESHIR